MHRKTRPQNSIFGVNGNPASAALAILSTLPFLMFMFLFTAFTAQPAQGQTYQVIYDFTGGRDGGNPEAGLTMDGAGHLYGTASQGGHTGGSCSYAGCGTVFKLTHTESGWMYYPLYAFQGDSDGVTPAANVTFGSDGSIYSTTAGGGVGCKPRGCGTVFKLVPPANASASIFSGWTESVLYRFMGPPDGRNPYHSPTTFSSDSSIYLTTVYGGQYDGGAAVSLAFYSGSWHETVIHDFLNDAPCSGVILDSFGNLYGTTLFGDSEYGSVFRLTSSANGWVADNLFSFDDDDGLNPLGGLIFDAGGNLYGTTDSGGGGSVFKLHPSGTGQWTLSTLYRFVGVMDEGPRASLLLDASGNLYGTTFDDGAYSAGNVFKLTPSGEGWIYTSLHDFTLGSDGWGPVSNVVIDASGNLFGTASGGGKYGYGVVWEITP